MNIRLVFSDPDLNFAGTVQVSTFGSPTPTRVDYYLDGFLQVSRSTAPFNWSLDTTVFNNGTHTVEARGFYKNGRTASDSKSVTIINGSPPADSTPPTVPGSFAKTADTPTSIDVSWTASTDAVGVVGYNLYKNNVFVASVADDLFYTFDNLQCGTTYTLSIEAFDARGNKSARSTITAATEACPAPAAVTVTSSIAAFGTVTQGDTWTVTTDPDVEKVELWIDGIKVVEGTTEPYTHVVATAAGYPHSFGICYWLDGVRKCLPTMFGVTVVAAPTPPPEPVTPVVTSNIKNGDSVTQGTNWVVSSVPPSTFCEFWADNVRIKTSSAEPHIVPLNLTPGTHRLGLCLTSEGSRFCYGQGGVFATITVLSAVSFVVTQTISEGQTLSGIVDWKATVSGKDATKVEFYVDNVLILTEVAAPYGDTAGFWNSASVSNGTHTFRVKAYATDGDITESIKTATVSNSSTPPPAPSSGSPFWAQNFNTFALGTSQSQSSPLNVHDSFSGVEIGGGQSVTPSRYSVISAPWGGRCAKMNLSPGQYDNTPRGRTEFRLFGPQQPTQSGIPNLDGTTFPRMKNGGDEVFYAFRFVPLFSGGVEIMHQWKLTGCLNPKMIPFFNFRPIGGNKMQMVMNGGVLNVDCNGNSIAGSRTWGQEFTGPDNSCVPNVINDYVIRMKLGWNVGSVGMGSFTVWYRQLNLTSPNEAASYTPIINNQTARIGWCSTTGAPLAPAYPRFGMYTVVDPAVFGSVTKSWYFDNIKFGQSFADVT